MDPYLFNAIRLTFSALTLAGCVVFVRIREKPNRPMMPPRRHWASTGLYIMLGGFAYQFLFLLGINATSAGNTAVILSAIPMWTAVLAFLILGEKLKLGAWAGLLVAIGGVIVVTLGKPANADSLSVSSSGFQGNLLISAAAFSWALLSVVSRKVMEAVSPLNLAFFCVALTLPLHYCVAGYTLKDAPAILNDPWLVAAILYSGVFSTGLAVAFWNYGVKQLGAAHASGFQNLVPLIALFSSWLLISEIPFFMQIVGGVLIIIGMLIIRRFRS